MTNSRPEHTRIQGVTSTQVLSWCGTVHVLRRTRATATWLEALERVGLAKPPANVAIMLTGKRRKRLDDIGEAAAGYEGRKQIVGVFLHDWPSGDFEDVYSLLTKRLGRLFPAAARRDTFLAYLSHAGLHEVGHARAMLRSLRKGALGEESVERAESAAEDYAWRELERRLPAETVLRLACVLFKEGSARRARSRPHGAAS